MTSCWGHKRYKCGGRKHFLKAQGEEFSCTDLESNTRSPTSAKFCLRFSTLADANSRHPGKYNWHFVPIKTILKPPVVLARTA